MTSAILTADAISDIIHSRDNALIIALASGLNSGSLKYYSGESNLIFDNDDLVSAWMEEYKEKSRLNKKSNYVDISAYIIDTLSQNGSSVDDIPDTDVEIAVAAYVEGADLIYSTDNHHSVSKSDICNSIDVSFLHYTDYFSN
ncbi:hypothetical protein [Oceanicaulis alexandrii]|uniref:hypothetical protein n=1 Tax=Oceanicaulis alexandrii TaxID=153233 RepID=UPI003B502C32